MKLFKSFKIRTKLVAINVILLIIILASQYLFQNVFLEKNYRNYKRDQILNSLSTYENINDEDGSMKKYQKELSENQNLTIFESDSKFEYLIDGTLENDYIVIKNKDGKEISIQMFFLDEIEKDFEIGDEITANIMTTNTDDMHIASEIIAKRNGNIVFESTTIDNITITSTDGDFDNDFKLESKEISGILVNYKKSSSEVNKHAQIIRYYTGTRDIELDEGKEKLEYIDYDDIPYVIGIKKSTNGYITAITSIKTSKDTVAMFNQFNIYLMLVGFVLISVLLLVYEKLITKPIIKIKDVSKEISNQNFKSKLDIKTGDELEELSQTVNNISKNLNQSINDLRQSNNKLEDEYKERIQIEQNQKFLFMNISHDLKTPLTVVRGNLQAIKDGIFDVQTYIEPTIVGVDEISKTLNEMLELSKLKSNKLEIKLNPCEIGRIIYQQYDRIKSLASDKNINVHFEMIDEAFTNIDESEIKKVIENLMINGIYHSPEKSKIYINLKEENSRYVWSIENTDVHVNLEEIDDLFKEFYQRDKSRTQNNKGNGLGLAIVKAILDAHDLNYSFVNTEKGMKFTIEFLKFIQS